MDRIAANVSQSIDALNQILQNATSANIDLDKKLLKATTEMSVGAELGKGQNIDTAG
jgi:hypothetical protein